MKSENQLETKPTDLALTAPAPPHLPGALLSVLRKGY